MPLGSLVSACSRRNQANNNFLILLNVSSSHRIGMLVHLFELIHRNLNRLGRGGCWLLLLHKLLQRWRGVLVALSGWSPWLSALSWFLPWEAAALVGVIPCCAHLPWGFDWRLVYNFLSAQVSCIYEVTVDWARIYTTIYKERSL